jgi:polyferredoxin
MISSLRLQTKKANLAKMQPIRIVVQIVFLALLIAGIYFKLRSVLTFLLPLSFIAGNYFCGWICPYGTAQDIFGKIAEQLYLNFVKKNLWVSYEE